MLRSIDETSQAPPRSGHSDRASLLRSGEDTLQLVALAEALRRRASSADVRTQPLEPRAEAVQRSWLEEMLRSINEPGYDTQRLDALADAASLSSRQDWDAQRLSALTRALRRRASSADVRTRPDEPRAEAAQHSWLRETLRSMNEPSQSEAMPRSGEEQAPPPLAARPEAEVQQLSALAAALRRRASSPNLRVVSLEPRAEAAQHAWLQESFCNAADA
jgi:primosomal protein N''